MVRGLTDFAILHKRLPCPAPGGDRTGHEARLGDGCEDQSGGIVIAQNLTKAFDAQDGNPLVVPPGKEQGAAILIQYEVISLNIFAVDPGFDLISSPSVEARIGVGIINAYGTTRFCDRAGDAAAHWNPDLAFFRQIFCHPKQQ